MSSMNPNWLPSDSPFAALGAQQPDWEKTNPFFVAPEPAAMTACATGEEYALVASVPLSSFDEVESFDDAVLVTVAWGNNTLLAEQVAAGESLVLGDEKSDFVLPESLGFSHWPVIVARGVEMMCIIPPNVTGLVELDGRTLSMEAAKAERLLASSLEIPGAFEIALRKGANLRLDLEGSFSVTVRTERAGKKIAPYAAGTLLSSIADKYVALSLVAHLGILGVVGGIMPKMNADDSDAISRDDMISMQHMLEASAEAEEQKHEEESNAGGTANKDDTAGGSGKQAREAEGALGAKQAPSQNTQYAVLKKNEGPKVLSRREELQMAASFGMNELLGNTASAHANTSPGAIWGDEANGHDDKDALGHMFGPSKDNAVGESGLGLSSTGIGGGGPWDGIGLGNFGDLGAGSGRLPGQGGDRTGNGGPGEKCEHPPCLGIGVGRPGLNHIPKAPRMVEVGPSSVGGHLPKEIIQRIVRQNAGRFRSCYESALRTNPQLRGRVVTKFIIGRDGAVSLSQDGGSDMPDANVTSCVVRAYQGISFPAPENGTVTVSYPLMFTPGE